METAISQTNQNEFIGYTINAEEQFLVFDSLGNVVKSIGRWNELMPELGHDSYLIASIHQGAFFGNPKKGFFVSAGIYTDKISLVNLTKGTKKTLSGPLNYFPSYKLINGPHGENIVIVTSTNPYMYDGGYVGNELIYLGFIGKNRIELQNLEDEFNNILVLDFDGNPLIHYKLDQPVLRFTVDEKRRKIFGTTTDKEPGILVFEY